MTQPDNQPDNVQRSLDDILADLQPETSEDQLDQILGDLPEGDEDHPDRTPAAGTNLDGDSDLDHSQENQEGGSTDLETTTGSELAIAGSKELEQTGGADRTQVLEEVISMLIADIDRFQSRLREAINHLVRTKRQNQQPGQ